MEEQLYLILTTRHKDQLFGGDVHLFWGRNSSGYSAILQRAGLYTKEQIKTKCDRGDIPIPYTYFGYDKEFFAQDIPYVKFPVLCSKSEEIKNMIADWQYEYRNGLNK